MGVRFRKYTQKFPDGKYKPICDKDVDICKGRESKQCPPDRPRNKDGKYKTCGTWVIEIFDEAKRWQSLVYPDVSSKKTAELRYALLLADRQRDELRLPRKKKVPTLSEYCNKYLEDFKHDKENTLLCKKRAITAIVKHLGDYRLNEVSDFIVKKYRIDRKIKDAVSDRTINQDIFVLSHIYNCGIKEKIIEKNPCSEVKRLKIDQTRDRVLAGEEIAIILDNLTGKDRLMILISLLGGLRLNEVVRLEKKDLDFSRNIMVFTQSKTGKLMNIPISTFLVEELNEYLDKHQSDRLFDDRPVNQLLVQEYSAYFSKLFKSLGIENFTYHNLRHSFGTFQSDAGADAFVTQSLLGHSDLTMTARYTHKQIASKRMAIESTTEYVLNISKEKDGAVIKLPT